MSCLSRAYVLVLKFKSENRANVVMPPINTVMFKDHLESR